jgi:hypothetical protein
VRVCKEFGVTSVVDAAHVIGQTPLDVQRAEPDYLVSVRLELCQTVGPADSLLELSQVVVFKAAQRDPLHSKTVLRDPTIPYTLTDHSILFRNHDKIRWSFPISWAYKSPPEQVDIGELFECKRNIIYISGD